MKSIPYRQVSLLNGSTNCILEKNPVDINSLLFFFDSCNSTVPDEFIVNSNGVSVGNYHNCKIIEVVSDSKLDNVVTKKGVLYKYYLSEYVCNKCRSYTTIGPKDLIGRFIVDWSESDYIKEQIKTNHSEYIECNYYVEYLDD